MKREILLLTNDDYHETVIAIYELMNHGEANLSDSELTQLRILALAAEEYENKVLGLTPHQKPKPPASQRTAFQSKYKKIN